VVAVTLGAAALTLSPTSAAEEATVTFIGTGLSPSDTACSLQAFNGLSTPDNNLITSPTCSITTPGIVQGTFVVGAYATSDIAWHVDVEGTPVNDVIPGTPVAFTVIPDVIVTPTSGTVNTVFTFTGSGFSSAAISCTAVTVPSFGAPGCSISGNTGQVSGSVLVPAGTVSGTYGMMVTDSTGKTATGIFTVGTPSALVVLNPAEVPQGTSVGAAGFGFNPTDTFCVITANNPVLFVSSPPPQCTISGGYAAGAFTVNPSALGGYYLITITACTIQPAFPNPCPAADSLDFASNFLGVTLATTLSIAITTTTTSLTTTSVATTTTSVATSFFYSSTTYQTTGIFFTSYSQLSLTTVSGQTTTTQTQTTSTTQTQTTVTVSTTTSYTTVPCGPLPCGFAVQPSPMNPAPSIDSTGLLAALLLLIPMLLRRLFT
jgi:rubredoxin